MGYDETGYFRGSSQTGLFLGGISKHSRAFFIKVKIQYWNIFGGY